MRINFYSESPDAGPGGAEQFIAVLAEALSPAHQVCILHHKPSAAEGVWGEYSGCDLSRVKFRHVALAQDKSNLCRTIWSRYRTAKAWRFELTQDCDLFIAMLHNKPPFCRARKGVMVILFPTYEPFRAENRGWYAHWEWNRRMASYPVKLSISDFSRGWARTRWGIESGVLYPPVALPRSPGIEKQNRILSVGRFATTGHTKKQIELLKTFREIQGDLPAWSYSSIGGLNDTQHDRIYFEEACTFREQNLIEVMANVDRGQLQRLYDEARIFWHAAGLGDDHFAQPEMAEHFGLVTVEAMAHGCVPVVIRKGGQPEIVEHGVNGFLWDSLAELKKYTRLLAADSALQERMAAAARLRAGHFSREACVNCLLQSLGLN